MDSQRPFFLLLLNIFCIIPNNDAGMLYPRQTESRSIQDLNGMWVFAADRSYNRNGSFEEMWWSKSLCQSTPTIPMPVPSSYNDITTDRSLRDFVGWVWYEKEFYVSADWKKKRTVLRIDSAHYYTIVWLNGKKVMEHNGGHLPFEAAVNEQLMWDGANRLTVAVNNTLTPHTLPPGTISFKSGPKYPPHYFVQNLQFDFFNYAGIHRSVRLYSTPQTYVDDITLLTNFTNSASSVKGEVSYSVSVVTHTNEASVKVAVVDHDGTTVASGSGIKGVLTIPNVKLWWPYTMSGKNFTDMYTFKVTVQSGEDSDVYRQPFGVRTVAVTKTQLLINNKPFYCHGAAKHEDSDIRGKGLDFALIARDFNMLRWLGANCFRTSHYPYAEEILEEADRWGIAVIDESPGVGIGKRDENFSNKSLAHHLEVMQEMVTRDKNKPSVIMWSVANEPNSATAKAEDYFSAVIARTRQLDGSRPVTFVSASDYMEDKVAHLTDVQCINRYYGWYSDTGHLEVIPYQLTDDLEHWYSKLNKPLIITEYGADTVPGLHREPSFVFTEEYQLEFLYQYHQVFDVLRKKYLVGEMVWNFADFMTDETVTRVVGNKKGLLTRQRQPKAAAHLIRRRYHDLANETSHGLPFKKQHHQYVMDAFVESLVKNDNL